MRRITYLIFLILLSNSVYGQVGESPLEIAIETTIERIGDYAQFAPIYVRILDNGNS